MSEQVTDSHKEEEKKEVINNDNNSEDREESRFKDGQILKFVRVRFPGHNKSYPFLIGKRKLAYGQKVVAMSDRGMTVGYINSFPYEIPFDKSMLPVRSINKIATDEDIVKQQELYKKEKDVETLCKKLIEKHNLDMNMTHVEFTQFGKKVVFYFTAPARVDFRGLVKDLVGELKLRIELRQISLRDRAAAVGGIGPCGRQLCCSSFLGRYGSVNIKMAKNQNLTLSSSKLNGVCGQLKCCLQYEDEVYEHKRKSLPYEGTIVRLKNGDTSRVERLHILSEQFDAITEKGVIRRYSINQVDKFLKDYKFPRSFEHISNETSNVIGLTEAENAKTQKFEEDIKEIKQTSRVDAQVIFEDLFGTETFLSQEELENIKKAREEQEAKERKREEESLKRQMMYMKKEVSVEETNEEDSSENRNRHPQKDGRSQDRKDRGPRNNNRSRNSKNRRNQKSAQGEGGERRNRNNRNRSNNRNRNKNTQTQTNKGSNS
jgi:cell fate regulator YaaT (PSP1 superfamily)